MQLSSLRGLRVFGLGLACGMASLGLASSALAQEGGGPAPAAAANADMEDPSAKDEDEDEETAAKPAPPAEERGQAVRTVSPTAPAAATEGAPLEDYALEQRNGFVRPANSSNLEWHGGLEADGGYASYTFERDQARPQAFYDTRGRFVVGPTVQYEFGEEKQWFVRARGELVAWMREYGAYQINADDVYGQFGLKGKWDFKVGRFRTWRVYHKGYGFDLYTLEDQGACRISTAVTGSCSLETGAGAFGPHTYEVSHIYDREPAGRAALHVYPTPWSAIELATGVGNNGANNTLGGRGAAMVHFDFLRVSAAAEYRSSKPAQEKAYTDVNTSQLVECPNCGVSRAYGFGGSLEVTVQPVAVALNAAQSHEKQYTATNGTLDQDATNKRTSLGGYAELDAGSLIMDRSLIVGFGLNRTEVVDDIKNFEQHYQGAAYLLYPLGFNAASVKLVFSQATLDIQSAKGAGMAETLPLGTMRAVRLRLTYPF
ncbi:MAG: hypothetical protein EOO73_01550 [Myxococcales bacterium]|nr:MAG: hypothetical protein EOO73_01550 [Myxococcales bacterium]